MVVMNAREPETLPLLGLNEYEAKAYRALLAEYPASAYRIAQRSGVPQSRIYEVVARLVEKGAATVEAGKPARYAPVSPDSLIAAARSRTARELDDLATELREAFAAHGEVTQATLRGEDAILAHAATLAGSAQDLLMIAGDPRTVEALLDRMPLTDARVRTVSLPAAAPGEYPIALLADSRRALIGRLGAQADALATDHPVIVSVLADHLMHRAVTETAHDMAAARTAPAESRQRADWQAWEEDKHRRLLSVH